MNASDYLLITKARDYAVAKHKGQLYGGQPYVSHLDEVCAILIECGYGGCLVLLLAAYLHDVVEDCAADWAGRVTLLDEIAALFGEEVKRLVWAVTGIGPTREARNTTIKIKLIDYPAAKPLKAADRTANLRAAGRERLARHARTYLAERAGFDPVVLAGLKGALVDALGEAYQCATVLVEADDDDVAVDRYCAALKLKLARGRARGRRGWNDPRQVTRWSLATDLRERVDDGDPLDIGLYAMMLHHHGWSAADDLAVAA